MDNDEDSYKITGDARPIKERDYQVQPILIASGNSTNIMCLLRFM
ncbi:5667_t:CDS:1, partial [Ambispora leptoticha]